MLVLKKGIINTLYQVIRTARPRQWLKNLSLFAAPVVAGHLFDGNKLLITSQAFLAFCALSSGIYFINDILDAPKDRRHPVKSNRPIASGKLSPDIAWVIAVALIFGSLFYAFMFVGTFFSFMLIAYIVVQILYSTYFRNVIILDSLVVGSGFVIRVFAGGIASNTSISSWLALTTIGISLLLAFGKRRSEKTLLKKFSEANGADTTVATRATLRHYPDNLLDSMITMSATYTMITYSMFVFQISSQAINEKLVTYLPSILRSPKWMMLTIPLVLYGVARYLYVIYEKEEGESPERVLMSDKPLLLTVVLWGTSVMAIIYLLPLFG